MAPSPAHLPLLQSPAPVQVGPPIPSFRRMTNVPLQQIPHSSATRRSRAPTWGQLKALTSQAERLVQEHGGNASDPATLFLSMMTVVACQSVSEEENGPSENSE
ncbi:MAPK-interacting and spindle-stabilizing protein-like [Carlito syrichta]|uniref:MAPK-interacting and spindle-stabilizing protein-like n=1 Tax=Carlito syrichta TaxID=1868482 RepID=A0A3Q0EJ75_CARSF|nr:MAPK-interacting and spindle-stabilizing protein-like [Carlito syrichta]XP_021574321.1 MAPK-interacting and spindle-stabilizing protein-like [Carlito syrichta]